jgi:methylenetetrahydrofolate dehydrogenase (NADP+)/methenyltetrahydrofolate cyclohydrolase
MANILTTNDYVEKQILALTEKVKSLHDQQHYPSLVVVLVGNNPSSLSYVTKKKVLCEQIGAKGCVYQLPETTSKNELLSVFKKINLDPNIHGCLLQLPLPEALQKEFTPLELSTLIGAEKDVDGFHPMNVAESSSRNDWSQSLAPCTPKGIIQFLDSMAFKFKGARAVVIGRSSIVGKPMATFLLQKDATVTMCHSKSGNIQDITQNSDLIITAAGVPNLITQDSLNAKRKQIIIDVGVNRVSTNTGYKLVGDVCTEVLENTSLSHTYITPVPKGVGPVTVVTLMENLLIAFNKQRS